jgi:hypothetical protein
LGIGGITGGGTTSTTNISGQVVKVSGETVLITGTLTASVSGQPVKTSGEIISVASGLFIEAGTSEFQVTPTVPDWRENASGAGVVVQSGIYIASGSYIQGVFTAVSDVSGQSVKISGETVSVASGLYFASGLWVIPLRRDVLSGEIHIMSGIVKISGETIVLASGAYIQGAFSASVSGQPVGISGATLSVVTADYTTLIDDYTYSGRTYIGKAAAGDSESGATWQIKSIDETGTFTKILFADGTAAFTKTWTDRSGYAY